MFSEKWAVNQLCWTSYVLLENTSPAAYSIYPWQLFPHLRYYLFKLSLQLRLCGHP